MKSIDVKVSKVDGLDGKLVGYADVVVDKAIAIHKIKIIEKDGKRFIAFPSIKRINKETKEPTYTDMIHPINAEARKAFEDAIFSEFDKLD